MNFLFQGGFVVTFTLGFSGLSSSVFTKSVQLSVSHVTVHVAALIRCEKWSYRGNH